VGAEKPWVVRTRGDPSLGGLVAPKGLERANKKLNRYKKKWQVTSKKEGGLKL